MEEKLSKLQEGTILVKTEDRKATEDRYLEKINQWRKRRRIFKDLWDSITENIPMDLKEFKVVRASVVFHICWLVPNVSLADLTFYFSFSLFFQEELGIEYDEDVGVSFQSYSELIPIGRKRKIGQWFLLGYHVHLDLGWGFLGIIQININVLVDSQKLNSF